MISKVICGDNIEVLKGFPDNYFDSVVTDSPYGLGQEPDANQVLMDWLQRGYHEVKAKSGFMGKVWDSFVPQPLFWKEVYRVLKPGGYLASFFGTRTYDWGVLALRFAGFEIEDQVHWVFGTGFPKGLDVSKAIDKLAAVERKVIGLLPAGTGPLKTGHANRGGGGGLTPEALQWEGWGTALKPANEPIVLARKPPEGTVAGNFKKWGVGYLNTDVNDLSTDQKPTKKQYNTCPGNYTRFQYVGKASQRERNAGLVEFGKEDSVSTKKNFHPTVKPIKLMRWLTRLVTPVGGIVLDPFAGSGSTGCACEQEGFSYVLIDNHPEYVEIARARCHHWAGQMSYRKIPTLFDML